MKKLNQMKAELEKKLEYFGVYAEEIVINQFDEEEKALLEKVGQNAENSLTVVTMFGTLEVMESGDLHLFDSERTYLKQYKKLGSAVKALGNLYK